MIAREGDTIFGILHSRFHETWALRLGTSLEDRPRYTPTTTFETFPFPEGLTPNIPAKDYASNPRANVIANAAKCLDKLRTAWLNPPDLIDTVSEVVPGYPDRILPKNEKAAAELKKRTLTNLYNARPQWLSDAHRDLDAAVAAPMAGRRIFPKTTRWQGCLNLTCRERRLNLQANLRSVKEAMARTTKRLNLSRGWPGQARP